MNNQSEFKKTITKNDDALFEDFKRTTTISQKDAVMFSLVFIARAEPVIAENEERYLEQLNAFFYAGDEEESVMFDNFDSALSIINTLNNSQKRMFVQLMCSLASLQQPMVRTKAERVGYIIERIGITENEFTSILLERLSKNQVLGL